MAVRGRERRDRKYFWIGIGASFVSGVLIALITAAITARTAPSSVAVSLLLGPQPTTTVTLTPTPQPASAPATSDSPSPTESTPTAGAAGYLSGMEVTDGRAPRVGPAEVNGATYPNSLLQQFGGCQKDQIASYNLGRAYTTFDTTVGLADTSDAGSEVDFRVRLDGKTLLDTGTVGLGQSKPLHLTVAQGLRLELETVFVKGDMGACSEPGFAVWGNAEVIP